MKTNQFIKLATIGSLIFGTSAAFAKTPTYLKIAPEFTETIKNLKTDIPNFYQDKANEFRALAKSKYQNNALMVAQLEKLADLLESSKANLPNSIDNEMNFIFLNLRKEIAGILQVQSEKRTKVTIDLLEEVSALVSIDELIASLDKSTTPAQIDFNEALFSENVNELKMALSDTHKNYWLNKLSDENLIEYSLSGYSLDTEIHNFRAHTFAKLPVEVRREGGCEGSAVNFNPAMLIGSSENTDSSGMLDVVKDARTINMLTKSRYINLICMRGVNKSVYFNPTTSTLIVTENSYPRKTLRESTPSQSEIIKALKKAAHQ